MSFRWLYFTGKNIMVREDFNITELIERVREGESPKQVIEEIIVREKLHDRRKDEKREERRDRASP